MTHKPPPSKKERKDGENRLSSKKLHKREQRLQERLQKAQAEQAQALERLEQAQARLQKRMAEVQRLEERLAQTHEQLETTQAPSIKPEPSEEQPLSTPSAEHASDDSAVVVVVPPVESQTSEVMPVTETASAPLEEQPQPVEESANSAISAPSSAEEVERAWQARAVAEAAEEEARAAVERAHEASLLLELGGVGGLHLEQELAQLEEEAKRTNLLADEARKKAESIAEITEEEELLEAGVTRTMATAAAQAAAEAEAQAEACSVRTRKARIMARQADQELALVRSAIRNGSLTGKEAETALQAAEDKSTRAHAELADAEVAEENAINAARNAEADAEVAEGMAVSAADQYMDDVKGQAIAEEEEQLRTSISAQQVSESDQSEADERTEKRPAIRPQELA